ncbi:hypothetical protein DFH08DRAFT_827321 [Mycena albidolilacea]|uniref:Uncharacterized protein n=1 Tax=Mycena albidolilacea TaxID=1033008 RepID=A0AAD6YYU5_9AGAR|nr:hypothetical protein DFH08DRAFT_827321 [Mycena albidolilacea]
MSLARHTAPDRTIKVEEDTRSSNDGNLNISTVDHSQKCACPHSITRTTAADMEAHTASSEHVKEEKMLSLPDMWERGSSPTHTEANYEQLQQLLEAAFRTWEAVMEQNIALAAELRRTRCELHNLRAFTEFAGNKLFEQATRRFRGIDSDTVSEDELEDSKSEEDM